MKITAGGDDAINRIRVLKSIELINSSNSFDWTPVGMWNEDGRRGWVSRRRRRSEGRGREGGRWRGNFNIGALQKQKRFPRIRVSAVRVAAVCLCWRYVNVRPLTEALANVTNVTSQNNVKSFITAAIPFLTAEKSGSIPADSGPPSPLPSPPTVLPSVAGQVGRSRWRHRQQVSATGCAGQRRQRLGPPGNEGGEEGGGRRKQCCRISELWQRWLLHHTGTPPGCW